MGEKHRRDERESRSQSEPRIPKGHFNSDGMSQGKQDGPVRKTPDAYNEHREERRDER